MRRRVEQLPVEVVPDSQCGPALLAAPQEVQTPSSTTDVVSVFADEFGRLLARRLLADPGRRRGYSLIELVWGATFFATLLRFAARFFGQ